MHWASRSSVGRQRRRLHADCHTGAEHDGVSGYGFDARNALRLPNQSLQHQRALQFRRGHRHNAGDSPSQPGRHRRRHGRQLARQLRRRRLQRHRRQCQLSYLRPGHSGRRQHLCLDFIYQQRECIKNPDGTGSIAAAWYGSTFTVDVNIDDGQMHTLSLYLLDWGNSGRSESIEVLNGSTGAELASTTVSNFSGGEYVTWLVQGNVQFVFTCLKGPNAVLSGLFFGGATPAASFVSTNTTTGRNWQGSYGADGYNVIGANASYPAYAQVATSQRQHLCLGFVHHGHECPGKSQRHRPASLRPGWLSFFHRRRQHSGRPGAHAEPLPARLGRILGRSESIDVLNAINGDVLASTTASNFSGGEYVTFTVQGERPVRLHVIGRPQCGPERHVLRRRHARRQLGQHRTRREATGRGATGPMATT